MSPSARQLHPTRRDLGRVALSAFLAAALEGRPGGSGHGATDAPRTARWTDDFPALEQRIGDHRLVYLDSAASTQRPTAVLDALIDFYRRDNANPGRALHTLARRAYERYESARSTLAEFINASSADEIAWVRGTTEGINLVASAWGRSQLRRGDQILLTIAEHASNLLPWRLAAQYTGAIVRFVDVDDEGRVSLDDLDRKLSERTRIVAFSHVSNVVGYVNPAAEICRRAHAAGARVLVDAAQSAPHLPLDVQDIDCDFLAFSSHKILGPMGIGVLWARRDVLEAMPPYQAGSNMAHEIDLGSEHMESAARKFGAGTPNVSGAVGFAAAVKYLSSLGRDAIENHEAALTAYGLEALRTVAGLRVLGPRSSPGRLPVFSFVLNGRAPQEILRRLDENGIAIRAGDLSALPLLKRLGVTSAARASCYLYTRTEDIDRLVDVLAAST